MLQCISHYETSDDEPYDRGQIWELEHLHTIIHSIYCHLKKTKYASSNV